MMTVIWGVLSAWNLLSLLSYRSPSTPFLFGYSAKYLALLTAYFAAVGAVSFSFVPGFPKGRFSRVLRLLGGIVLLFLQLLCLFQFNGLIFNTVRFPWIFPLHLFFVFFFLLYCEIQPLAYVFLLFAAAASIAFKTLDMALRTNTLMLAGLDLTESKRSILTFELYPYEGWHVQANFDHQGDMPWLERQPYKDYRVRSGSMGFFIDFDLKNPPPKEPGEFRIILIGGSGAQGWGAQTNELMMYRQLEKQLNARLASRKLRVRVINFAMAGFLTYQDFIALNRWAHPLEPDLIVSYSGINDVVHTALRSTDGFQLFPELDAYVLASRGSEISPPLRPLKLLFPNLMTRTNMGIALKLLFSYDYFFRRAQESYRANRGIECSSPKDCLSELSLPLYVGAMQSIKRDFMGIPILIAWEASDMRKFDPEMGADFFNRMFEEIQRRLSRYMNDDWYFINVNAMFERDPDPSVGAHIGNKGHEIVSKLLADHVMDFIVRQNGGRIARRLLERRR